MTRAEFSKLAAAIRTYYPHSNALPNKEAMELWYAEVGGLDYGLATEALRKHVRTEKWPPTIAELIAGVKKTEDERYYKALEDKLVYGIGDGDIQAMNRRLMEG